MARMHNWLGLAILVAALSGCVSQEKYNAMKLSRDQALADLDKAQNDATTWQGKAEAYEKQLALLGANNNNFGALVTNLQKQLADAQATNAELERKYEELAGRAPTVVQSPGYHALPEDLTNALQALAAQYPDVIEFDAARGVLKFKSDVTFASGSAVVNERAKTVIAKFAEILNTAAASYDLMVVGHTDNTPVSRPETKALHPDNWYLSAHRAIAVAADLVMNNVSKSRLGVAGYADQRPIASNATEGGKAQNRRVEVLILPTSAHPVVQPGTGTPHRGTVRPEFNKDLNKDSGAEPKPVPAAPLNK